MARPMPADRSRPRPVPPVPFPDRDHARSHLPVPFTSFVGRQHEVADICDLVRRPDVRLVTLTGPGGVGKTRLALRVAETLGGEFADGVAFVDLTLLADSDLVAPTVALALGIPEARDRPLAARIVDVLRHRQLFLVLDNFEQIKEAAPLVAEVLASCPQLVVLVTSREPLSLSAERVVAVLPLPLPDPTRPAEELATSDAVRLFTDRAQASRAEFALSDANIAAVADICARVDGLPLAIELAAARVTHLPPAALLARLDRRLPLLTGGKRDLPERQRTLRGAIAWSYDLLAPAEQSMFRSLAVFVGGCTLEATEAVVPAAVNPGLDVLDGVAALTDKNLLRQEDGPAAAPRYRMLETVREFALEHLAESGVEQAVRDAHAAHFLALAEDAAAGGRSGYEAAWLERLEPERANLRAALGWLDERGEARALLRLATALYRFWKVHGPVAEGRSWLRRALALPAPAGDPGRATALVSAADLARMQGETAAAVALLGEAAAVARAGDDRQALAGVFGLGGIVALEQGDHAEAERLLEAGVALSRTQDPQSLAGRYLNSLLDTLGIVARRRGDLDQATALVEEALALASARGFAWSVAMHLANLGAIARERGDLARARDLYRDGLQLAWAQRDRRNTASILVGLAAVVAASGRPVAAARLCGTAEALLDIAGVDLPPAGRTDREHADRVLRAALGEARFAAERAVGRALTSEQAFALADEVAADAPPPVAGHGLTPREREVVRLVAEGLTDREIAARLFLSPRTVQRHVAGVLDALNLPSRSAAAAYAARHGLAGED